MDSGKDQANGYTTTVMYTKESSRMTSKMVMVGKFTNRVRVLKVYSRMETDMKEF